MILKKISTLAKAVQNIDAWRSIWEGSGGVVPSNYVKMFFRELSPNIKLTEALV